uniref:TIGR01777 family oxidoreductase n=1 Tax=Cephaloticoccus sp. TaxID=1985742 RepID=UPI00404A4FE1
MTPKHRILVSGASGMLGGALVPSLRAMGHEVHTLVRRPVQNANEIEWDPAAGKLDAAQLKGITAVIHLAGANVAGGRWTQQRRALIRDSRIESARTLLRAMSELEHKPEVVISAAATGVYGERGDEILTEESSSGTGFLSEVCRDWEGKLFEAETMGLRTVALRFGLVLSPTGGVLSKILPVFKLGLGGRLGDGRQWMSWVALDDLLAIVQMALTEKRVRGPINVVAPNPVRNAEFTRLLAQVLHRPYFFPVPAAILRLIFGQMANETVLASSRVMPAKLTELGYQFRHADLDQTFRHLLTR